MLHTRLIHPQGIGVVEIIGDWTRDIKAVISVVDDCHPGTNISEYGPPSNLSAFRNTIQRQAPAFERLMKEVSSALGQEFDAIVMDRFGIERFSVDDRKKILYALANSLGLASPTDPRRKRVVWDVKKVVCPDGYFATFGESDREASYHTDSQYCVKPERFFLLYVVNPAVCGGGVSFFRNAKQIKMELSGTDHGLQVIDMLSRREIPFLIPPAFSVSGDEFFKEYTISSIFGTDPLFRWRLDTMKEGISAHPWLCSNDTIRALEYLSNVINNPINEYRELFGADTLCIVNNHHILHGRTSFKDHDRHLIRIRFHDPSVGV